MSLPGRKSHMRRLHWPPRPRVWLCPGNMCHHASVGGPGISRPCTHRLIPDVILASAWGHLSLTSRIFSWKDEEAALEVLLYVSDSKDLVTKCNVILGSINLELKLEITKMEHYMSQFKIKFDTTLTEHYCLNHFSEQLTRTFAVLVWKFVVSLAPDKHHCLFWVLWRTLCYGPAQSGQGQLLPLASPLVGRAPGDCGGWDRPRHHQYLLLRKHRQGLQGEGNSLWICSSSSGTHRNIQQSSRSHSGKNNWQNVNSKGKITITTPKPTWTLKETLAWF